MIVRSEIFTLTALGALTVAAAAYFVLYDVLTTWIFAGLVAGVLLIKLAYSGKKILAIVLVAFLLRMGLASLQEYYEILPYAWDEPLYNQISLIVASDLSIRNEELAELSNRELTQRLAYDDRGVYAELGRRNYIELKMKLANPAFSYMEKLAILWGANTNFYYGFISGQLYLLLDKTPFTMRAVNSFFGALAVYCIYLIIRFVFSGRRSAEITAMAVAFSPSSITFTGLHMRDALTCLLFVSFCYFFLKWMCYPSWRTAAAWGLLCVAMLFFRPINLVIFMAIAIPGASFLFYNKLKRDFLGRFLFGLAALCVLACAGYWSVTKIQIQAKDPFLARLESERGWRTSGGSAYLVDQSYESWQDVVLSLPTRFIYFSFGPFPWEVKNGFQFLASLEGAFILLCFAKAIQSLNRMRNRGEGSSVVLCLLGFAIVGLLANSLFDSNYGTAVRHRMVYVFALIPFAFNHAYRMHRPESETAVLPSPDEGLHRR